MIFKNYMALALLEAQKALESNEIPVGAILVNEAGDKIYSSGNLTIDHSNPLAHAEIIIIQQAIRENNGGHLQYYSLYTTLEPCVMCAGAIALAKIGKLYIGCEDIRFGAILNGCKVFSGNFTNHVPEIYEGIMENDCSSILKNFFRFKRS